MLSSHMTKFVYFMFFESDFYEVRCALRGGKNRKLPSDSVMLITKACKHSDLFGAQPPLSSTAVLKSVQICLN